MVKFFLFFLLACASVQAAPPLLVQGPPAPKNQLAPATPAARERSLRHEAARHGAKPALKPTPQPLWKGNDVTEEHKLLPVICWGIIITSLVVCALIPYPGQYPASLDS